MTPPSLPLPGGETFDVADLAGTAQVARRVADALRAGVVVTLEGQLGAGKTTFVRSLVESLGGDPRDVSSPTYVLLHTYATPLGPVHHLDAYRLGGAGDLEALGFDELLNDGIAIVEWASRVADALPPPAGRVDIRIEATGPTSRRFEIDGLAKQGV